MSDIEEVQGKRVLIRFEGKKCIHSRNCVLSRPDVFVPNVEGDWIHPDAVSPEHVMVTAEACPSGAIVFERTDGGPNEEAPPVNSLRIRENGPYAFRAALRLANHASPYRATLCRCGASKNKPFCDGSHATASFRATGEPTPPGAKTDALATKDGELVIEPTKNGPLHVTGNLEICAGTGHPIARVTEAWLCRCGRSATKPFCDGTHRKIGFQAP